MRRRVVLLVIALAVLLVGAAPASASFPGANGSIALFIPFYGGFPETHFTSYDPSTGGTEIPTGAAYEPMHVAWSPDGSRAAFDGQTQADYEAGNLLRRALFVMNADGSGLQQVGRGDRERSQPVWSPDGRRLAFVQNNGPSAGRTDVYTIATSGADLKKVTTSAGHDWAPDWSVDGTIAYSCEVGGAAHVCRRAASGGSRTVLTPAMGFKEASSPSWSPSGRNLVFSGTRTNDQSGVFRSSRTGTDVRFLVAEGSRPIWSPDATRVLYSRWCGGEEPCWLLETAKATDGTDRRQMIGGNEDGWGIGTQGWRPVR